MDFLFLLSTNTTTAAVEGVLTAKARGCTAAGVLLLGAAIFVLTTRWARNYFILSSVILILYLHIADRTTALGTSLHMNLYIG